MQFRKQYACLFIFITRHGNTNDWVAYHDVNGKVRLPYFSYQHVPEPSLQNGSPLLTCALFKDCHTSSDAINYGGQTQPDGSVDYITDSDGWCKA